MQCGTNAAAVGQAEHKLKLAVARVASQDLVELLQALRAVLLLIEKSPLPEAKRLIARLHKSKESSLVWVQRMAEDCDSRFRGKPRHGHAKTLPG
jgi:hypothetical protein